MLPEYWYGGEELPCPVKTKLQALKVALKEPISRGAYKQQDDWHRRAGASGGLQG